MTDDAATATIVVGCDDGPGTDDAVALAATIAAAMGAELVIAAAAAELPPPPAGGSRDEDVAEAVAPALRRARMALSEIEGAPPARSRALAEPPAQALADVARSEEASMVVVGPTHRGPIGRVLPGSTGRRLIAESGVPVAVAPRGYGDVDDGREIERVGVALDGSEESAAALAAAEAFAYLIEADLDRIEIDGPARDLLEVPGDAVDLMVIGSEARGALASWLMGSPSTEVASLAPWPMVVVTPAMDAGRAAGA